MLKDELAKAQDRIKELEDAAETHAGEVASNKQKISELEGKVAELENSAKTHASAIEAKDKANADLAEKVSALTGEKTKLEGDVKKLEGEAKGADERAREIAARNGANLPAKQPGAGDKTTDDAQLATGTPAQKLASIFEPKS